MSRNCFPSIVELLARQSEAGCGDSVEVPEEVYVELGREDREAEGVVRGRGGSYDSD